MDWVYNQDADTHTADLAPYTLVVRHAGNGRWQWKVYEDINRYEFRVVRSGETGCIRAAKMAADVSLAEYRRGSWKPLRTKMDLVEALFKDGTANVGVACPDGVTVVYGILQRAERESGCGRCFNLDIETPTGVKTVFWKSVD